MRVMAVPLLSAAYPLDTWVDNLPTPQFRLKPFQTTRIPAPNCALLYRFLSGGVDFDFHLLRAQARMDGFKPHFAGRFLGANPHRPSSTNQRKWIVPYDPPRAFNLKLDRIIRKWTNRPKLIGDAKHDSR